MMCANEAVERGKINRGVRLLVHTLEIAASICRLHDIAVDRSTPCTGGKVIVPHNAHPPLCHGHRRGQKKVGGHFVLASVVCNRDEIGIVQCRGIIPRQTGGEEHERPPMTAPTPTSLTQPSKERKSTR